MEKNQKLPSIVWLRITDYMHGWINYELAGSLTVKNQRVISVQHLPGAREVLRMETVEDMLQKEPIGNSMSDVRKNCMDAGLVLDPGFIERDYKLTKETMKLYMPIECPKMCLTPNGVLRPWTLYVNLGHRQASALQKLLRDEFWNAVAEFDREYAARLDGKKYPAIDMVEDFCARTKTPDLYVEAIRREWQRRVKRSKN